MRGWFNRRPDPRPKPSDIDRLCALKREHGDRLVNGLVDRHGVATAIRALSGKMSDAWYSAETEQAQAVFAAHERKAAEIEARADQIAVKCATAEAMREQIAEMKSRIAAIKELRRWPMADRVDDTLAMLGFEADETA